MDARLNYAETTVAQKFLKHINSAGRVLKDSPLPAATQALVVNWQIVIWSGWP